LLTFFEILDNVGCKFKKTRPLFDFFSSKPKQPTQQFSSFMTHPWGHLKRCVSTLDDPLYRMTPTPKKEFFRTLVVLFLDFSKMKSNLSRSQSHPDWKKEARANNQRGKKSQAPTMCSPAAESVWPPGDRMPTVEIEQILCVNAGKRPAPTMCSPA
jgi:hypothetical protein